MLRSYRCIIVAALGWLSLAASPPEQGAQRDKPASQSADQGDLSRIAAALEKLPQAQAPDTGCKAGQDKRDSDLCAQWKAADGAAASAVWTERAFYLGVAGLCIGFLTLFAAIFAAKYARDAASAAKESLKSIKYLEDAIITIEFTDVVFDDRGIVSAVPEIFNIGRSTAKIYGYSINGTERTFPIIIAANKSYRAPRIKLEITSDNGDFPIDITLRTSLRPLGVFTGIGQVVREVVNNEPQLLMRTLLWNEYRKK